MKHKVLIQKMAVLAVSSALILSGCKSSTDSKNPDVQNGETKEQALEETGSIPAKKVSDITFPLEEKVTLDVFSYGLWTGGDTYQTNYVTDYIEEKTNIHLNFVYDVDGDDGATKLNLVMSDPANLPDIFLAAYWTKNELYLYGKQGLIIPLNEYLEDAPNWNAMNAASPSRRKDLTMGDGNVYLYGNTNECYHARYINRMWIYKPWVDSLLGGKMPETIDELYQYLTAVKEQDPNGNGIADEIPLTGSDQGWMANPITWFSNSYLEVPKEGGFIVNDGTVEYQFVKDEYKEAIAFLAKLYSEGLLDSQVFTQDGTQYAATIDNQGENIVGLYPNAMMACDTTPLMEGKPGEYQNWVALDPVAGPDGVRFTSCTPDSYLGGTNGIVSANCKNPEIAVALFDWLASEENTLIQTYGPQGVTWDWVDGGNSVDGSPAKYIVYGTKDLKTDENGTIDWAAYGFEKSYDNYVYNTNVAIINLSEGLRGAMYVEDPAANLEAILQAAAESYSQYAPPADTILPNVMLSEDDAKKVTEYKLSIDGYVTQASVQFITGDLNIETDWDSYVKRINEMGLDDYTTIYQRAFDEYQKIQ